MQTSLISIRKDESVPLPVEISLSFVPLLNYLKKRLKTENTVKAEYYRFIIARFEKEFGWKSEIPMNDLSKYRELFELTFLVLTPLAADEDELFWGLTTPVPAALFASTNGLHRFLTDVSTSDQTNAFLDQKVKLKLEMRFIYRLILERFYAISIENKEIIYTYKDPRSNLVKYYKAEVDARFVEINVKGSLPDLDDQSLANCFQEVTNYEEVEHLLPVVLPLDNFSFEGFSILSLKDVTVQHSIDRIREVLVNHSYEGDQYRQIGEALRTLSGNEDLEFRPLPVRMVNGKSVFRFDADESMQSILMSEANRPFITKEAFNALVDDYKSNPRLLLFNDLNEQEVSSDLLPQLLKKTKINSYALLPVNYHSEMVGVIEIHSKKEVSFNEKLFTKIQQAIPLIAQLLKYSSDEFDSKIEAVIRDKFTPLQPSVQWKFNEVAWNFLQKNYSSLNEPEIETIRFENVYPLYGAVDIRNSTIERNKAIHEDIKNQLNQLMSTLMELRKLSDQHSIDNIAFECKKWSDQFQDYFTTQDEMALNSFLESDVNTYLRDIQQKFPVTSNVIDNYFNTIAESDGPTFKNRVELETSLQLINTRLNQYFENAQKELQEAYPFYFEKFRTDGVEYDIYIGQSIAEEKPFDISFVKALRRWQIKSMAEVARLTHRLVPQMPRHLETTQLIFTHSNTIDISFRNDERRFDVEGAYNIRYQVVKKRIDKVLIKNTQERLTQPGKIALVYFNQREASEYAEYINEFQKLGLLDNDLEYLDLEEVQGVSRLKALRVSVILNKEA
jgi:GAF domain-containing protein